MPDPAAEVPPVEAPSDVPATADADAYAAERARVGATVYVFQGASFQHSSGNGLALGGATTPSPLLGFWGARANGVWWPADFDFGHLGLDAAFDLRLVPLHISGGHQLAAPLDTHVGAVVRRGPGPISLGYGAAMRLVTPVAIDYTDATLTTAHPHIFPALALRGALNAWWEPTDGRLAGGSARAEASVSLGTVIGVGGRVNVDVPVGMYPYLLRVGAGVDFDHAWRLGANAARVTTLDGTIMVGAARAF